MKHAPPSRAPATPRSRQAQKIASWVEAGPGNRFVAEIAVLEVVRRQPPALVDAEPPEQGDVGRRAAESDAADPPPLTGDGGQPDVLARPGARHVFSMSGTRRPRWRATPFRLGSPGRVGAAGAPAARQSRGPRCQTPSALPAGSRKVATHRSPSRYGGFVTTPPQAVILRTVLSTRST